MDALLTLIKAQAPELEEKASKIVEKVEILEQFRTLVSSMGLGSEDRDSLNDAIMAILDGIKKGEDIGDRARTLKRKMGNAFENHSISGDFFLAFNDDLGIHGDNGIIRWVDVHGKFHNATKDKNNNMLPAVVSNEGHQEWWIHGSPISPVNDGVIYPHKIECDGTKTYLIDDFRFIVNSTGVEISTHRGYTTILSVGFSFNCDIIVKSSKHLSRKFVLDDKRRISIN